MLQERLAICCLSTPPLDNALRQGLLPLGQQGHLIAQARSLQLLQSKEPPEHARIVSENFRQLSHDFLFLLQEFPKLLDEFIIHLRDLSLLRIEDGL